MLRLIIHPVCSRHKLVNSSSPKKKGFFSHMIYRFHRTSDENLQQYMVIREYSGSFMYCILSSDESRLNILERICSTFPSCRISVHSVSYDNSILLEDQYPEKHRNDGFYEIALHKWNDIKDSVLSTAHTEQEKTKSAAVRAVHIPQRFLAGKTDM